MGPGHPLRAPGRPRRVQLNGRFVVVETERTGVLFGGDELLHLARLSDDHLRTRVVDAVGELPVRKAGREWDDHGAEPLAGPVQLDRLRLVREHTGDPIASFDAAPGEAG